MYIPKNTLHFVMQSKGGAGKSVCSVLLSQYFVDRLGSDNVQLVDTDPNNKTLGAFKALNVDKLDIIKPVGMEKEIDSAKFDIFIEKFVTEDKPMVVDTGSGEYLAITNYLISNNVLPQLMEMDKEIYIHCPINFGQSSFETFRCLHWLSNAFLDANIVVWENEFFGLKDDIHSYKKPDNLRGIIKITKRNRDTYERDFMNMLSQNMTFAEVADNSGFNFMQKSRLHQIKNDVFTQIDALWG